MEERGTEECEEEGDDDSARVGCFVGFAVGKRFKYVRIASAKRSRAGKLSYVLEDGTLLKAADEGAKWFWPPKARTGGLQVVKRPLGAAANGAMLRSLAERLFGGRLPQLPQTLLKRCLEAAGARLDAQGSVIRVTDEEVEVTVDLPSVDCNSAGVQAASACTVGPCGDLFCLVREVPLQGMPDRHGSMRLFRLPLPLRPGLVPLELCVLDSDFNLLRATWVAQGLIVLAEREGTGNVAQLRGWDGSLVWELVGRRLPGFDWLDHVVPLGTGFLLLGTDYTGGTAGRTVFLHCNAEGRDAEEWPQGRALVDLQGGLFDNGLHVLFLEEDASALLFVAHGEKPAENEGEEKEVRICGLWRCERSGSSISVTAKLELRHFFVANLHHLPDGRILLQDHYAKLIWLDGRDLHVMAKGSIVNITGSNEPGEDGCSCRESHVRFVR